MIKLINPQEKSEKAGKSVLLFEANEWKISLATNSGQSSTAPDILGRKTRFV